LGALPERGDHRASEGRHRLFSFDVLNIPGRMHSTVVCPFTVDGQRYIVSFGRLDWVRYAQGRRLELASPRGREQQRINLVQVKPPHSSSSAQVLPAQVLELKFGFGSIPQMQSAALEP